MVSKTEKNRIFRTVDLIGLIAIVSITIGTVSFFVTQGLDDDRSERAGSMAQALALQLESSFSRNLSKPNGDRAPASSVAGFGKIGRDPWGRAFRYTVQSSETLPNQVRVYVWSAGPNGTDETGSEYLETKTKPKGDDVAYVHEFNTIR